MKIKICFHNWRTIEIRGIPYNFCQKCHKAQWTAKKKSLIGITIKKQNYALWWRKKGKEKKEEKIS